MSTNKNENNKDNNIKMTSQHSSRREQIKIIAKKIHNYAMKIQNACRTYSFRKKIKMAIEKRKKNLLMIRNSLVTEAKENNSISNKTLNNKRKNITKVYKSENSIFNKAKHLLRALYSVITIRNIIFVSCATITFAFTNEITRRFILSCCNVSIKFVISNINKLAFIFNNNLLPLIHSFAALPAAPYIVLSAYVISIVIMAYCIVKLAKESDRIPPLQSSCPDTESSKNLALKNADKPKLDVFNNTDLKPKNRPKI
ncbi:MAG: hypothetical protein VX335_03095 [Pseudomonadota bacterium]|nr:hypothetical protein [Pseudomonadota bacterium]